MPPSNDGPDRVADVSTVRWQASGSPSNGHGNARSVAQLLSLLTRRPAIDHDPLGDRALDLVRTVDWDDATLSRVRMSAWVSVSDTALDRRRSGERRDGVVGRLGGSMAVVDLEQDLVVVYAMSRMFPTTDHVVQSIRVVPAAPRHEPDPQPGGSPRCPTRHRRRLPRFWQRSGDRVGVGNEDRGQPDPVLHDEDVVGPPFDLGIEIGSRGGQ